MSTLLGIATRNLPRQPMQEHTSSAVSTQTGIGHDVRGKPGFRQVTVLSEAQWNEACEALGQTLHWTTRRANLLISELIFGPHTINQVLCVGEAKFRITGETDPCHRMDQSHPGLRDALTPDWRGGVTCRVIQAGRISLGDPVSIVDNIQQKLEF